MEQKSLLIASVSHFAEAVTDTSTQSENYPFTRILREQGLSQIISALYREILGQRYRLSGKTDMRYLLTGEARKLDCIEHIKKIQTYPLIEVTIKEHKKNRSRAQNDTFHWWCDIIAKDIGTTQEYIKDSLKLKVLGTERRTVDGVELTEIRSSAKLEKAEFCRLMNATELLAHELNITLPYPDDYKIAMEA